MCHLFKVRLNTSRPSFPGRLMFALARRSLASAMSFAFRYQGFGESGIPGNTRKPMNATGIVMMPSMIKSHL